MGLASKVSGYQPSGGGQSGGNAAPVQHQGDTSGGSGYPPTQNPQGNFYPTPAGYGQGSGGNQAPSAPPQQSGGYPTIQSGLNSSFQAGGQPSQPSRFPSMTGGGGGNQPHLGGGGGGGPSFQYSPSQQRPQQQYGQSSYGQPGQSPYGQPGQQQPSRYGGSQGYQAPPPQQSGYGHSQNRYKPPQQMGYAQGYQSHPQQRQQQPSYGQQGASNVSGQAIEKVRSIIQINGLQAFYPPQKLQVLEQRLAGVDFSALARKWNMSLELAVDLASLALYDTVIYADDSTSMKYADNGERIDDLKLILERVADVSTLFDDDGISIRAINSNAEGDNITSASAAAAYVGNLRFSGMTPLGTKMEERILEPMVFQPIKHRSLPKPVLVVTITDGEPTQEPSSKIFSVIKNAKKVTGNSAYGPKAVAFSFAQVGKDTEAQAFLEKLDTDRHVGDLVDCTSYFELEAEEYKKKGVILTPEIWMVKMLVGAVDPSYDEQDE